MFNHTKYKERIILVISLMIVISCYCGGTIRVFGLSETLHSEPGPYYQPTVIIDQTIGGSNLDYAYSVITTSDGGFAFSGYTYSYGAGGSDMWLVKTNALGEIEWEKTFGGTGLDYGFAIINTSDGGYALAGGTESYGVGDSDIWLVKANSIGEIEWNQTYGGIAGDYSFAILKTSDEGYAVVGRTESYGAGGSDMWLVKTNNIGAIEWNHTYGGINSDSGDDAILTEDGGYAIAGGTQSYGAGNADMWLVKTDESGIVEWNKTYGGISEDRAMSVISASDGGYVIAGLTKSYGAGNRDIWMVKTDINGHMEWNQTFGGSENDFADSIVQISDGGYVLAGRTNSFGSGSEDLWLVKTNASGQLEWDLTLGGNQEDVAYSVIETSENTYALVGRTASKGMGNADLWFVKVKMVLIIPKTTNLILIEMNFISLVILALFYKKRTKNSIS